MFLILCFGETQKNPTWLLFPVQDFTCTFKGSFTLWRQWQWKGLNNSISVVAIAVTMWTPQPVTMIPIFSHCCCCHNWVQNPFHDNSQWQKYLTNIFHCNRIVNESYQLVSMSFMALWFRILIILESTKIGNCIKCCMEDYNEWFMVSHNCRTYYCFRRVFYLYLLFYSLQKVWLQ